VGDNLCGFQRSKSNLCSVFKYLENKKVGGGGLANKKRQCIGYFYTPRKAVIQLEGSFVYFYSVWYTHISEVN